MLRRFLALISVIILPGCHGYPSGVVPVENFEINRYLGRWYEIARLDHSFERGLDQVTADYSLAGENRLRVVNRGYSEAANIWKEAVGKAKFARESDEGYLSVSFFGPFYSSYVIFGLDQDEYRYAFISGPNHSYLWLLSRTPEVEKEVLDYFLETAQNAGFNTEKLIYVQQEEAGATQL